MLNPNNVGACDGIFDVVRGMAICDDMVAVTQILRSIQVCFTDRPVATKKFLRLRPYDVGMPAC